MFVHVCVTDLSIDLYAFMTSDTVDHFYSGKGLKPHINKSVCVCAGVPAGFACRSESRQQHSTEIPNHRPPAPHPASGTAHYTWNTPFKHPTDVFNIVFIHMGLIPTFTMLCNKIKLKKR